NTVTDLLDRGYIPDNRRLRRALGVDEERKPSVFWEQYDNTPVIDVKDEALVARLKARLAAGLGRAPGFRSSGSPGGCGRGRLHGGVGTRVALGFSGLPPQKRGERVHRRGAVRQGGVVERPEVERLARLRRACLCALAQPHPGLGAHEVGAELGG